MKHGRRVFDSMQWTAITVTVGVIAFLGTTAVIEAFRAAYNVLFR